MKYNFLFTAILTGSFFVANAQQSAKPEDTEIWQPVPKVVTPGNTFRDAPSDAIVLFDGKSLDQWVLTKDTNSIAKWIVADDMMTVDKSVGDIQTKRKFTDFQLHIEYRIPTNITGSGQARGNSGIFLAALPWGAGGYELQVLDNYNNATYSNGQAGAIYKQTMPLVNACRKPGEWQSYDVIYTSPKFNKDGMITHPAYITVLQNGVLVQNHTPIFGTTPYIGKPQYQVHGKGPIKLQDHGNPTSFRNIWIREI